MKKATFFVKNKDNPAVKAVIKKISNEIFGEIDSILGGTFAAGLSEVANEQFSPFLTAQFAKDTSGDEILKTIKEIETHLEKLNISQSSILYKIDDNDSIQP